MLKGREVACSVLILAFESICVCLESLPLVPFPQLLPFTTDALKPSFFGVHSDPGNLLPLLFALSPCF